MIQTYTRLKAADNTGARQIMCINIMGGSGKKFAGVGDIIVCSVKKATPMASVKKGDVVRAVVIRSTTPYRRRDGTYIRFDDNAAVILGEKNNPKGTRVFGPVAREIRDAQFTKIISLAPEVI